MTRLIPTAFPPLDERMFKVDKPLRAELLREIAHAQNYLWSRMGRVHAMSGYEGNGGEVIIGHAFPLTETTPEGRDGIRVATFLAPAKWWASAKLYLRGHAYKTATEASTMTGHIEAAAYGIGDAAPISSTGSTLNYGSSTSVETLYQLILDTPGDRNVEIRVWISAEGSKTGDAFGLEYLSARFFTKAEEAGTPPAKWLPHAADLPDDWSIDAHTIRTLIRNTVAHWNYRPPEVAQIYFRANSNNTTAWKRVGRFRALVSPYAETLSASFAFHTSTTNGYNVRLLANGTVIASDSVSGPEDEWFIDEFGLPEAVDNTPVEVEFVIEVACQFADASNLYGIVLNGAMIWETALSPTSVTRYGVAGDVIPFSVPSNYAPLSDETLSGDEVIRASHIRQLLENDLWLSARRPKTLVASWLHKTLKRVDTDHSTGAPFTGTFVSDVLDWTPGRPSQPYMPGAPKNITVHGDASASDTFGAAPAGDARNSLDGFARAPNGFSETGQSLGTLKEWPVPQTYYRKGRRLGRYLLGIATAANGDAHTVTGARVSMWMRARRLAPSRPFTFDDGLGPLAEEGYYRGRAKLEIRRAGVLFWNVPILDEVSAPDTVLRWQPPTSQEAFVLRDARNGFDVAGRLPLIASALKPFNASQTRAEGTLFEVELASCYVADEPLPQSAIEALP